MNRPKRTAFIIIACSGICLTTLPEVKATTSYRPGPEISGAAIKKEYDMQWFHISESCNLRAKAKDVDEKCSDGTGNQWVEIDDFIDLPQTVWSGDGLNGSTGASITWKMDAATSESGVVITATIKDKPTDPSADANDDDTSAMKTMYAYEAIAFLNCTSSNSGSPSKNILESTGSADSVALSLQEAEVWAKDDGDSKQIDAFGTATWVLRTKPSTATLGSNGQLKVEIGVNASGHIYGMTFDNDINDGENSVSVGLSGGTGFSAGISISHVLADTAEATVGGGFAFSSDELGDDTDDKLEMISGDDPDPLFYVYDDYDEVTYGYAPNDVTFRGDKGSEAKAKAVIESQTKCKGDSSVSQGKTSSDGIVTYSIGVPTYESGSFPGPEDGYND